MFPILSFLPKSMTMFKRDVISVYPVSCGEYKFLTNSCSLLDSENYVTVIMRRYAKLDYTGTAEADADAVELLPSTMPNRMINRQLPPNSATLSAIRSPNVN